VLARAIDTSINFIISVFSIVMISTILMTSTGRIGKARAADIYRFSENSLLRNCKKPPTGPLCT
jgi:hypothetical protein